jgi:tRNA G18 (ribose-2'-O)-methylase SpoU
MQEPPELAIEIVLIAHNLRSCHNVGSLLRTAEGLGVKEVILSGYTPYPLRPKDARLPHLAAKIDKQIQKTALGAETSQRWTQADDLSTALKRLRNNGYVLAAVEQAVTSQSLPDYRPPAKLALLVGREVEGVETEVLDQMDVILEIPMFGHKESFNVVQAAAMTLYHSRFYTAWVSTG